MSGAKKYGPIPEDLKNLYGRAIAFRHTYGGDKFIGAGTVEVLIERIGRAEAALAAKSSNESSNSAVSD